MSWKEKRKQSFAVNDRPKLGEKRVYCKEHEGAISFVTYEKNEDAETGGNVSIGNKITGVLLGTARAYESFDRDFGKNGGTCRTAYVFNQNNCTLFDPTGKVLIRGHVDDVKIYMEKETGAKAKNLMVLFVLTADGIYAVYTNMVIAIDQINRYKKNVELNFIELDIQEYSSESDVTNAGVKILGKFVDKNKPKFANISMGKPITDEFAQKMNIESYFELFDSFVDYYTKSKVDDVTEEGEPKMTKAEALDIQSKIDSYNNKSSDAVEDDDSDDLPF